MRHGFLWAFVLGAGVLAQGGCGGGGGGDTPSPAVNITIVAGSGQIGAVGTVLPGALIVVVTDSAARPVSGATVTWA